MKTLLWARIGDQDGYNAYDSLEDVAEILAEILGHALVERYQGPALTGITAGPFQGDNGISLFWGDDRAQITRDLNETELATIRDFLA